MASTSGPHLLIHPMLTNTNYQTWVSKMQTFLSSNELEEIADTTFTKSDQASLNAMTNTQRRAYNENKNENDKALWAIKQAIEEHIYPKIEGGKTTKEAWDILDTTYQGTTKVKNAKLQILRRDFETLFMKETDSMDQHMTQMKHVVN